jgi:alpha-tubulin suppressor-like RCC1 family protein
MNKSWFVFNTVAVLSVLSVACTPAPSPPVVISLEGQFLAARAVKKCVPLGITDGTLLAWGKNDKGQLGDGTNINNSSIKPVVGVSNIIAVFAFELHVVALKSDGTLLSWGDNTYSQLGDGTTTSRSTPSPVLNASNIVGVAVGSRSFHNLALRTDGTVLAWGYNVTGQLGDSTTTSRSTPIVVTQAGLTDVRALAVGERHSVALLGNGKLVSWGDNLYGQRGIADLPTNTFIRVP